MARFHILEGWVPSWRSQTKPIHVPYVGSQLKLCEYQNIHLPYVGSELKPCKDKPIHFPYALPCLAACFGALSWPALLGCAAVNSSFLAWSTRQNIILVSLAALHGTDRLGFETECSRRGLVAFVSAA